MSYQNFDLEFYQAGGLCHVKARAFNGEAKHSFSFPFTSEEAKDIILILEESLAKHTLDDVIVKQFGRKLFEAVFQKEVHALYKSGLALAQAQGREGLRLRLHVQEVAELALLPWEYLFDASANQFLGFNRQTAIVRYFDLHKIIQPLRLKPPLRLLVMIASPKTLLSLDVEAEKAKLQEVLGDLLRRQLVEIVWLEQATMEELQKTLRRSAFHLFHFIGHGDFEAKSNQGWLAFEDEEQALAQVSAEQLGAMLHNHRSLRLVVLNSCKGARASLANPFAGTAATLVHLGIPAVVAMQFSISDAAAIKFAGAFYGAIADRMPVDAAMTEARVALFAGNHHFEWGTPVLFMRSPDGALFVDRSQSAQKKINRRAAFIYMLVTLLCAALTFLIFSVLPKSTVIDIEVFAKSLSFTMSPSHAEENVPLLYASLWGNQVSLEKCQPIKLTVSSLTIGRSARTISNPLTIMPDPAAGKITLISAASEISLQEMTCAAGSRSHLQWSEGSLNIAIQQSAPPPNAQLSFPEEISLLAQACRVVDGTGRDLAPIEGDTVQIRLHDLGRSLLVEGKSGELKISMQQDAVAAAEETQFFSEQLVEELDFSQAILRGGKILIQSTIDSILVRRSFSQENLRFKSSGDLKLTAKPNRFAIYDLSQAAPHGLRVKAQGRFKSLAIGRGDLRSELVPRYLSLITENPATSVFITWMGWVATVAAPFVLRLKFKQVKSKSIRQNNLMAK